MEQKQNYPKEVIAKAKTLYLEGHSRKKIVEETGMKLSSIKYHAGKSWTAERSLMRSELIETLSESKAIDLVEITNYGLTFLKNTLKKLVNDAETNTSPGLLKTISTIIFEINKIKALDEGRPTEILSEINPSSAIEIRELLKSDPFLEIEDAETIDTDTITND